jgi:polar amino acid transport system substrate-binding protein
LPGIILCLAFAHAAGSDLSLMTTDYPPYYGSSLANGGPMTELVVEAFRKVGYNTTVEFVPWIRAMEQAKAGKADGLLGAWYSEEREKWFVFSEALPGNELVLLKRKGTTPARFTSFEDLRSYTIGIVRGYRNPEAFDAAALRTDEAISDTVNLTKLARGRVDLILIDRALASFLLSTKLTEYAGALEALEPPLEVVPMYVLISRKLPNYKNAIADFNRGLELLRAEGAVDEIMRRHGM